MSSVKYLLDEHVDPRFRRALKRYASEMIVWCIGDVTAPALSTLDPEILLWCEENGFILVTNNRASMPVHLQNHLATSRHGLMQSYRVILRYKNSSQNFGCYFFDQ